MERGSLGVCRRFEGEVQVEVEGREFSHCWIERIDEVVTRSRFDSEGPEFEASESLSCHLLYYFSTNQLNSKEWKRKRIASRSTNFVQGFKNLIPQFLLVLDTVPRFSRLPR